MLRNYLICLVLIVLISTASAYSVDELRDNRKYTTFDLALETKQVVLQPQSTELIHMLVNVETQKPMSFSIIAQDYDNVRVSISPTITAIDDFYKSLTINVFNAYPGTYPIRVIVTGTVGDLITTKEITIFVKVVESQEYKYDTSAYTNVMPEITNIEFNKRNFLIAPGQSDAIVVNALNVGSTSNYTISTYPTVDGLDVNFKEYMYVFNKDHETFMLGTIYVDGNYTERFTTLRLMLTEVSTGMKTDLGTINVTLATPEFVFDKNTDVNKTILTITNIGTIDGIIKINAKDTEFETMIAPGQSRTYELPKSEITVTSDDVLLHKIEFNETKLDIEKDAIMSGLFSLYQSSSANLALTIIVVALVLYLLYRLVGKIGLFGKTVSVKSLDLKQ